MVTNFCVIKHAHTDWPCDRQRSVGEWHRSNIEVIITTHHPPQCIEPDTQPSSCLVVGMTMTLH